MAQLACTDQVRFGVFTEAMWYLLTTARNVVAPYLWDFVYITAARNGVHSGPADPHYADKALDFRTHNFPARGLKVQFVDELQAKLGPLWYVYLEDPDSANEHVHAQVRRGCTWPPPARAVSSRTVSA